ncbi:hypothetical protein DPMN_143708 [Dreissena polymorpha]|uniref:Uncharacterized protein n=1 Tax=Dreissena polymorpha TaxID=45954 RepID=A0A9D4GGQ1_DREPO|nr:hypothetical protein DPMN_143708 [Dreissena polymorpha]
MIPVSDNRLRCSVPMEARDCMSSMRPKVPMKTAPRTWGSTSNARLGVPRVRVAAVQVGIGTNMPTKGDPAHMLIMGALRTGKTTGTVVDTQIQKSAPRDRSEEGIVQIGASIP